MFPVPRLRRHYRLIVAAVLAPGVVLSLAYLGVPVALGAHPRWATTIALIGAAAGLALAALADALRLDRMPALVAAAVLTGLAMALATYGKAEFAASYAEDRLAGRFWYFGWIGAAAGLTATLAVALAPGRRGT